MRTTQPAPVLASVHVGRRRDYSADLDTRLAAQSAINDPLDGAVWAGRSDLADDHQGDLTVHAGPDRAILEPGLASYRSWHAELSQPDRARGALDENFAESKLTELTIDLGAWYRITEAVINVSQSPGASFKLSVDPEPAMPLARCRALIRGWQDRLKSEAGTNEVPG